MFKLVLLYNTIFLYYKNYTFWQLLTYNILFWIKMLVQYNNRKHFCALRNNLLKTPYIMIGWLCYGPLQEKEKSDKENKMLQQKRRYNKNEQGKEERERLK